MALSTSGPSKLTKRLHCCRTWTVQLYSPVAPMWPRAIHASLGRLESTTQTHLNRFSYFCTAHGRVLSGMSFRLKIAPSHGAIWTGNTKDIKRRGRRVQLVVACCHQEVLLHRGLIMASRNTEALMFATILVVFVLEVATNTGKNNSRISTFYLTQVAHYVFHCAVHFCKYCSVRVRVSQS